MAAYESQGKTEEKRKRLRERREKLASLLAREREIYEVGLTKIVFISFVSTLHSKNLKILHRVDSVT